MNSATMFCVKGSAGVWPVVNFAVVGQRSARHCQVYAMIARRVDGFRSLGLPRRRGLAVGQREKLSGAERPSRQLWVKQNVRNVRFPLNMQLAGTRVGIQLDLLCGHSFARHILQKTFQCCGCQHVMYLLSFRLPPRILGVVYFVLSPQQAGPTVPYDATPKSRTSYSTCVKNGLHDVLPRDSVEKETLPKRGENGVMSTP